MKLCPSLPTSRHGSHAHIGALLLLLLLLPLHRWPGRRGAQGHGRAGAGGRTGHRQLAACGAHCKCHLNVLVVPARDAGLAKKKLSPTVHTIAHTPILPFLQSLACASPATPPALVYPAASLGAAPCHQLGPCAAPVEDQGFADSARHDAARRELQPSRSQRCAAPGAALACGGCAQGRGQASGWRSRCCWRQRCWS